MTDVLREAIARIDNEPATNKRCEDWDKKISSEQDTDWDNGWFAGWSQYDESWQENWKNGSSW